MSCICAFSFLLNQSSVLACVQGDVHQALIVLQKGVAQCFPDDKPLMDPRSLQTKGQAMLLVGRFMEETANFESNAIMKVYKVSAMITGLWILQALLQRAHQYMLCFSGCYQPSARVGGWKLLPSQVL